MNHSHLKRKKQQFDQINANIHLNKYINISVQTPTTITTQQTNWFSGVYVDPNHLYGSVWMDLFMDAVCYFISHWFGHNR